MAMQYNEVMKAVDKHLHDIVKAHCHIGGIRVVKGGN
jgi:hypothetical protein